MPRPFLSHAARRDIDQILTYLANEAGSSVVAKYRRSLMRLFDLLGDQPTLGAPRPRLARGVRLSVVDPYLVLYRRVGADVTVLRILHGKRKITPKLLRSRAEDT